MLMIYDPEWSTTNTPLFSQKYDVYAASLQKYDVHRERRQQSKIERLLYYRKQKYNVNQWVGSTPDLIVR